MTEKMTKQPQKAQNHKTEKYCFEPNIWSKLSTLARSIMTKLMRMHKIHGIRYASNTNCYLLLLNKLYNNFTLAGFKTRGRFDEYKVERKMAILQGKA